MPFIGIDLGTTYSCVAAQQRGKIEVISNEQGNRTTPSCVAFADGKRLVGEAAQHQRSRNPANTVYDAKRLIGRSYSDPAVQSDKRRWQFIVEDQDGKPRIQVEHKKQKRKFAPEQISSMVLHQMKKYAENFLGEGVLGAVITVPAYFNDAQRRATRDAATIADLHVLGLLNEPTAAAIAYGLQKDVKEKRNVLIFDLGGGTFDVTVLTIQGENFEVKATSGDTHLGGQDFNDRLFSHFVAALAQKHGVDIRNDERAKSRLMDACEKTKRTLSTARVADIHLDGLVGKEDFSTHITRARFEQLNEDLFRGTLETVEKALEDARMKKETVEEVVLVGGSTRIPMIQELIKEYFGGAKICMTINPDEAVATGAAAYAASLSKKPTPRARQFNLRDVIPLSLGIETKGEFMTVVVGRNTQIPVQKTHNFTTVKDNQKVVDFRVFEGERPNTKQNHLLDNFLVRKIPPAPAGKPVLETCFDIDKDGVLTVSAKETKRGNRGSITITQQSRKKNEEEIKQMVEEARRFREEDEAWKEKTSLVNKLDEGAMRAKKAIEKLGTGRQSAANRRALAKCDDALHRNNHDLTVEELTAMISEFEEMQMDME